MSTTPNEDDTGKEPAEPREPIHMALSGEQVVAAVKHACFTGTLDEREVISIAVEALSALWLYDKIAAIRAALEDDEERTELVNAIEDDLADAA